MMPVDEQRKPALPSMVAQFPDIGHDSDAQCQLALLEYEDRRARGERPGLMSFAAGFPACRTRVIQQLLIRERLDEIGALDSKTLELPPPDPEFSWPEVGDRLLGFTLLGTLGDGAFARVYLARETALGDRLVAIKVSLEGKDLDLPDAAAEAEILGRLSHPSIVPIHSIQNDSLSGFTLVCMPFLGNTTLADELDYVYSPPAKAARAWVILAAATPPRLRQGCGPLADPGVVFQHGTYIDGVLELGIQLADALAYVHEKNIFHRDLKPSNVLVRPDGRPMLLDFNLSSDQNVGGGKQLIGGTLLYMSPEQLRATDENSGSRPCLLDARSDLFSLGVILYELLAGDHPFIAWKSTEPRLGEEKLRSVMSLRQQLGPRPLRAVNPLIDKHLAGLMEKCLAPNPRQRFQTGAELAAALRQCQNPEHRLRRWLLRHPRRALVTAAAVVAITAAVFALAAAVRLPARERHLNQGIHALEAGQYEQAVDLLGRSLAEENSFRGHMARARAYQKMAKFKEALEEFKAADNLKPSGHTKVCIAYCFSRLETPLHDAAAAFYNLAHRQGYVSAVVYNNWGFSMFMTNISADFDAKKRFSEAVALDPNLQAAYYNFMKVELDMVQTGHRKAKLTPKGLDSLAKVFATGPVNGQMHADAANFLILAKNLEPRWKERALHHLEQAITRGVRPVFSVVDDDPAFRRIHRDTPLGQGVVDRPRIIDPFLSIDE
jgi:serine/threonine protein kinase